MTERELEKKCSELAAIKRLGKQAQLQAEKIAGIDKEFDLEEMVQMDITFRVYSLGAGKTSGEVNVWMGCGPVCVQKIYTTIKDAVELELKEYERRLDELGE